MTSFFSWLADVLGADRYAAHAICLTNDPLIIFLYVIGDLVTAASYFAIGTTLYIYQREAMKPSTFSRSTRVLYGSFIALCGLSHFTDVVVLYTGVYRLDVVVTGAMAAVSAATTVTTYGDVSGRSA